VSGVFREFPSYLERYEPAFEGGDDDEDLRNIRGTMLSWLRQKVYQQEHFDIYLAANW